MTRVLIADNCPDTVQSLTLLLRLWGHEVWGAGDGPAALREASRRRPNLVLMDVALCRLDGYEVARRLRRSPDLPRMMLVALTGYSDDEHRLRADRAGFDFYVLKPIDPECLRQLLALVGAAPTPRTGRAPPIPHVAIDESEEGSDLTVCLCC